MDPLRPLETVHGNGDHDDVSVTSWVSVCVRGLWKVQQKHVKCQQNVVACSSGYYPRLGSLCRVRVKLKPNTDETNGSVPEGNTKPSVQLDQPLTETEVTAFQRCHDSVLQVPLGDWTTLRLGEGQCDVTEACLERMHAGDKCEILLSPVVDGPNEYVSQPSEENTPLCATVELQAFTPGKEPWEMSPSEKWEWVKSHKERGGARFRNGDLYGAVDSYSRAMKLLIPLYGHLRNLEKKGEGQEMEDQPYTDDETQHRPSANELRTVKAGLHSNLSLCQLKLNQPELAKASAAKATELEPGGTKAWYRLGQACQMVNELEEAKQAFRTLLQLQPESPAALKALKDIASKEKASNAQLGIRLSKMFS